MSRCTRAAVLLLASLVPAAASPTRAPKFGEVRTAAVITVALAVGNTGREEKRVTYAPPPGWYIRGHRVECKEKTGLSSFTVNTLPREWSYAAEDQVRAAYKTMIDATAKGGGQGVGAKLAAAQERSLGEARRAHSSHHVLMVEAVARGEGWLRGGGSLHLTVMADLVYVGTKEDLARALAEAAE